MGEAKRRRDRAADGIQVRNFVTNAVLTARPAGDPLALREEVRQRGLAVAAGKVPSDAHVPCNGCTECCYHAGVEVQPGFDPPQRIAHLDVVEREPGTFWLRKRDDGACVHLGPAGCTVREYRPAACRGYDCRVLSMFGVNDSFDGDHRQPLWAFEPHSFESRVFLATAQMMGQIEFAKRRKSGESRSATDIAIAVTNDPMFGQVQQALATFARASREQQTAMLGVDPATITPEQMHQAAKAMFGDLPRPTS